MRFLMVMGVMAGLAAAAPSMADPSERPDNLDACMAAAQGMTMEADFCLSDEAERVEARLGPALEAARRIAEEGQRASLEQSQADFLAYRESWCGAKGGFLGSGHNQAYASCVIRLTEERIRALEGFDEM